MSVFAKFRSSSSVDLDADPLGLEDAVATVRRHQNKLHENRRRITELESVVLAPQAEGNIRRDGAVSGNLDHMRKQLAELHAARDELTMLNSGVQFRQNELFQAQDELSRRLRRRLVVGQAAQVRALDEVVQGRVLVALAELEAAAAEFAEFSVRGTFNAETNPLLRRVAEFRRALTDPAEGFWPKLVEHAEKVWADEPAAEAILASNAALEQRPPNLAGLF